MKFIIFSFLLIPLTLWSQTDECPKSGEIISSTFEKVSSDIAKNEYVRKGTILIPSTSKFEGMLKARLYDDFKVRTCVSKAFNYQQEVCENVPLDLALGLGNDLFKSFFDLKLTLLKRSELFAQNVSYSHGQSSTTRLEQAGEILNVLTRDALSGGIPKSWEKVTTLLAASVSEGFLNYALVDEITKTSSLKNQKTLGFIPMPGVTLKEGKGNGKILPLFDLSISVDVRTNLIKKLLVGVPSRSAEDLSRTFIEFAASNGVPSTWDQFVLMLKFSMTKGAISEEVFNKVTIGFETNNRSKLGFELVAVKCQIENRTKYTNIIDVKNVRKFTREVISNFQLTIANAPLVGTESEKIFVIFDGLTPIRIESDERFNSYRIVNQITENGIVRMNVTGTRKMVTPENSINAEVLHQGNHINLRIQDRAFNPLVKGKTYAEIEFFEKIPLWKDKKLATQLIEIKDGFLNTILSKVALTKPSRKAYVKISLKIVGSPYYSSNKSEVLEFKE